MLPAAVENHTLFINQKIEKSCKFTEKRVDNIYIYIYI